MKRERDYCSVLDASARQVELRSSKDWKQRILLKKPGFFSANDKTKIGENIKDLTNN